MKISCQSCGAKYNIADEKVRGKIVKIACKKCGARIEIDGREQQEQANEQDETRVYDQAQAAAAAAGAIDAWTVSVDDNDQREINTAQLVELYQQGAINADTFVWRDGMADWAAIRDVEPLRDQLSAMPPAPAAGSAPPPHYSQPPTAVYTAPAVPGFNGGGGGYQEQAPMAAAGGGYPSPPIDTAQPARLGGSRRGGGADLFGAPSEDEDVATSAPQPGVALGGGGGMFGAAVAGDQRPIGARNENSVLFSLAALTASGPTNTAPTQSDDEKSGLIDIQKLAAAAKPGGPKDDRAKLDDIMNLGGGGAFGSALGAPILAPPPAAVFEMPSEQSSQKKASPLLWVAILLGVAIVGLLVYIVLRKPEETTAKKDKKDDDNGLTTKKDKGDKEPSTKDTASAATAGSSESAPPDSTGGPIGKPGSKPSGGATGTAVKPGTTGTGTAPAASTTSTGGAPTTTGPGGKPCKTLEECMGAGKADPPKPKEDPPKPTGGAEFDKGAATSALKSVPYKDCGTGGGGKVAVTFGPSGSVVGSSVTAGDYDAGTKSCIAGRFRSAKVPAFSGDPKTVGWGINL